VFEGELHFLVILICIVGQLYFLAVLI
jgi:hypothetical protein